MVDRSLYDLLNESAKSAYSNLLDRPENSPGGGDAGASVLWPSPLLATPEHRTFAEDMARVLSGNEYNWAYIQKSGGAADALERKNLDRAALEAWVQDYDQGADRLAGLPPWQRYK